jgi:hypothetical protein
MISDRMVTFSRLLFYPLHKAAISLDFGRRKRVGYINDVKITAQFEIFFLENNTVMLNIRRKGIFALQLESLFYIKVC